MKTWADIQDEYRTLFNSTSSLSIEQLYTLATFLRKQPDMMMVHRDVAADNHDLLLWLPNSRELVHVYPTDIDTFAIVNKDKNTQQIVNLHDIMPVLQTELRNAAR